MSAVEVKQIFDGVETKCLSPNAVKTRISDEIFLLTVKDKLFFSLECNCNQEGVVDLYGVCDSKSGQCKCKKYQWEGLRCHIPISKFSNCVYCSSEIEHHIVETKELKARCSCL